VHVRQPDDRPVIMVTVREPAAMPDDGRPWRLQSVPYLRPLAHIKRFSDFGQAYYQRQARRNGFDEALLTGPDGVISEGSVTNIGFVHGGSFTWPSAPMLAGVTMQLLDRNVDSYGIVIARHEVRLADLRVRLTRDRVRADPARRRTRARRRILCSSRLRRSVIIGARAILPLTGRAYRSLPAERNDSYHPCMNGFASRRLSWPAGVRSARIDPLGEDDRR
jgi:hypothetical protein